MNNVLGDSGITAIAGWLRGLSRRQQATSNNIANIDTPGYQRQEVPFESELRQAMGQSSNRLTTSDPRHFAVGASARNQPGTQATQLLTSSRLDSNNVDIDQEMVTLSETQLRYQAAASALNTKLAILRNVIRGG